MKRLTESNIATKDLLSSTNKLLALVGITAKQIISLNELTRVASSMFVAIFEALFRTRVEGVVRRPKGPRDYISNCQVILDNLSHQLQMDLRHITGESIFQGDRRALSNLVNILLRIATITGKSSGQNNMNHFVMSKGSESISSHESAFAHMDGEILASWGTGRNGHNDGLEQLDTDDAQAFPEGKNQQLQGELELKKEDIPLDLPPSFQLATSVDFQRRDDEPEADISNGRKYHDNRSPCSGMDDNLDMNQLKSSLSEFDQHKRVESARQRRDDHMKKKVFQASIRNASNAQKSLDALQKQWSEDNARDEYAGLLRRKHDENMMLRKVQNGILKHMREAQLDQSAEAKERIQEIKKEAHWHFQSLQNLFDDRIKTLRNQDMALRVSQDEDVSSYKILHDKLKRFNYVKQKKTLGEKRQMLQQKRLYSAQMRQDTHQQLLSYLAMGNAWENSLRSSWPPCSMSSKKLSKAVNQISGMELPQYERNNVYSPRAKTYVHKKKKIKRPRSAPQSR